MNTSILKIPSKYQIREELQEMIIKELEGPAEGEEEELLNNDPRDRYLVGMLSPKNQLIDRTEYEDISISGNVSTEDEKEDSSAPTADSFLPSSFGFTFCVDEKTEFIQINAKWGFYERIDGDYIDEKTGNSKKIWKRKQVNNTSLPINITTQKNINIVINDDFPDVYVKGIIRKGNGIKIITLFLVNDQEESKTLKSSTWIFQTKLEVSDPYGKDIFIKKTLIKKEGKLDTLDYDEYMTMEMIYRNKVEFAVGHGVSVHVDISKNNPHRATKISSISIPLYEVAKTTPPTKEEIPDMSELVLDMKELSEFSFDDIKTKLFSLVESYSKWIEKQSEKLNFKDLENYKDSPEKSLEKCKEAKKRISEGIQLLINDKNAFEAFKFANKSMYLQRIQTIIAQKKRRNEPCNRDEIDISKNRSWYPFQLAFVLLNLPGITDLEHEERINPTEAIADLLWFPTGGGKTEAYLGLSAYTMAIRRLQGEIDGHNGENGIAVLMRYTLRLLTLQQFQRATALVCACESIRREDELKWGKTPFRIGLWVGNKTTPNTTNQSKENVIREKSYSYNTGNSGTGSVNQLTNCPWCGSEINIGRNIEIDDFKKGRGRTITYCGDSLGRCIFSKAHSDMEGLPILVVDEEIYRLLPSLLIATVDKFAQMTWKGETQMLFGKVSSYCPRHGFISPEIEDSPSHNKTDKFPKTENIPMKNLRPPDLIIQDELHLISGPLGTMVGLFETAIDKLSSWEVNGKTVRPKVVLSTATVKRASEQVQRIFCREVRVFPPNGLDIEDNFFSRQRIPSEENFGRKYMGICAPGKKHKTVLIKTYSAYLAASQSLFNKYGETADPWMTLVGYFNTIRELGGMRRLIDDIIRNQLRSMEQRGLANRNLGFDKIDELTSRKDATEIPKTLERLETSFKTLENYKKGIKDNKISPLDILLSTNMISVGVDVQRLGLMVIAGQPKYTAEYIQASSRVGRTHPGLVCTIYNWSKPRDLTHYESFEHYHSTFYKHVEALSVTPFAPRAVDKGLTSLLVSIIRLSGEKFNANKDAIEIDERHEYVTEAIKYIAKRASNTTYSQKIQDSITQELKSRLDTWRAIANKTTGGSKLGYKQKKDGLTKALLKEPGKSAWDDLTCLTSMRDVESAVNLVMFNDDSIDFISQAVEIIPMSNSKEIDNE